MGEASQRHLAPAGEQVWADPLPTPPTWHHLLATPVTELWASKRGCVLSTSRMR